MTDTVAHVYGLNPADITFTDGDGLDPQSPAWGNLYLGESVVIEIRDVTGDDDSIAKLEEMATRLTLLAREARRQRALRAGVAPDMAGITTVAPGWKTATAEARCRTCGGTGREWELPAGRWRPCPDCADATSEAEIAAAEQRLAEHKQARAEEEEAGRADEPF